VSHVTELDGTRRKALIQELLTLPLLRPDGLVDPDVWALRVALGAIPCVDGVLVRRAKGGLLGGVIRRKTGRFPNKLALVGGVVAQHESIETALKRHYKTDLGLDIALPMGWDHPACMRQYAPQKDGANLEGFCHDPGKHSYASTHIVAAQGDVADLTFGTTDLGGQEAMGLEWFHLWSTPEDAEWSYDMRPTFIEVMSKATELEGAGKFSF
jgi:ADP-ribose pyrophosphatase YjhB (NUDIX family)